MALDLRHTNMLGICKRFHVHSGMESSFVLSIIVLRISAKCKSKLSLQAVTLDSPLLLGQCHMQSKTPFIKPLYFMSQ